MKSTELYPPSASTRSRSPEEELAEQQLLLEERSRWDVSRRDFLKSAGLLGSAAAIGAPALASAQQHSAEATVPVTLNVNGQEHQLSLDPRTSLLDALREDLKLTGSKKGCDHGQCGACTVLLNGRRINSCLTLALTVEGDKVVTIEGLATGDQLHPVQQAFLDHDGYQCGYCTPGQICSAVALLDEAKRGELSQVSMPVNRSGPVDLTVEEIKERMSGNICRCGAYPGIVAAVRQTAGGRAMAQLNASRLNASQLNANHSLPAVKELS
ncbi:MAG TPA: 2Fe-2S iron-sulfur cluster-binding protein [Acidisarcina sp.]